MIMASLIKTALIGAGFIGRVHARNLAQNPDFDLAYIVDGNEKVGRAVADESGAEWLAVPDAVFADDSIDAVWIATPPASHAALLRAARAANKAIFCEKPLSPDMDEANQLVAEFGGYGKPVFLGFNRRFDPSHARLKALIDDGAVGEIEMVVITSRDPNPPPVDYMRATPGGIFYDTMIHDFDIARWLTGAEPTSVFATASAHLDTELNPDKDPDAATATLRMTNGAVCQFICSRRASFGYDQRIEVFGSKLRPTMRRHRSSSPIATAFTEIRCRTFSPIAMPRPTASKSTPSPGLSVAKMSHILEPLTARLPCGSASMRCRRRVKTSQSSPEAILRADGAKSTHRHI